MTTTTTPDEMAKTGPLAASEPGAGVDDRAIDYRPAILSNAQLPPPSKIGPRLRSLDIFRGLTIVGMILVNNPGSDARYDVLEHANWHGWTPTDLVFPFFMFIMGVAIPFSLGKRRVAQASRGLLLAHVWARAIALVMLGMLIRAAFLSFPTLPPGYGGLAVLRIAVITFVYASMLALLVPWRSPRMQNLLPHIIAVIFFVLLFTLHFVSKHATDGGLDVSLLGGGMFRPERFRIPGVLQRIGIGYGIAGTIALFAGWRTILTTAIALLVVYSALMLKAPFPNHVTGSLTKEDNLERKIDEAVFDRYTVEPDGKRHYVSRHTYGEYPDPEGLLSTIPAAATPLLGILLGLWLRRTDRTNVEKCAAMLAMGVCVTILGVCLGEWLMPINKKIWTPSFVVFTAGMAMLGLGAIFWLVDVRGRRWWALPFTIYGMNAIAAYLAGDLLPHFANMIHVGDKSVSLEHFVRERSVAAVQAFSDSLQHLSPHMPVIATPANLALVWPIVLILAVLLLMSLLYVLKIFVKV